MSGNGGALQKVAIVTDSIACLPQDTVERYGVTVMPLSFYFKGKIYRDWVDITPTEAYKLFLKDPDSFKTSAVSPGMYHEAFQEASKKTDRICCITLSSKLSACHTAAIEAKDQFENEHPGVTISVMDSEVAAASETLIVLAAARAAAGGEDLPGVLETAYEIKRRAELYIFLDTIRHVYRSGRIPKIASQMGSILNIKPMLTFSGGVLKFVGMSRSRKSGVEKVLRHMKEGIGGKPAHVVVSHAYAPEDAEELRKLIAGEFNCVELHVTEFSPIMGYACGTGTLGTAFYADE